MVCSWVSKLTLLIFFLPKVFLELRKVLGRKENWLHLRVPQNSCQTAQPYSTGGLIYVIRLNRAGHVTVGEGVVLLVIVIIAFLLGGISYQGHKLTTVIHEDNGGWYVVDELLTEYHVLPYGDGFTLFVSFCGSK